MIYYLELCGLIRHSLNNILVKLVIRYFSLQILRGRKIINWDLFRPLINIIRSRALLPLQQWSQDPYIRVYKWRLKRYLVYPVRYFFGVQKSRLQSSFKTVEKFLLISKIRANDTQAHNQCLQTCEPESYDLVFPPEVWIEIAKYGVDAITLMSVNKALLNIFGRLVYEELHGILVISSLEKLKASDQCFLRNGPDFEDSDLDGYGIYVRSKASKNFTHEAIDIAYNGRSQHNELIPISEINKKYMRGRKVYPSANVSLDCANIPTIVSSYSGLRCIITEIIRNRDSVMKKYINKFSIDVMVLSKFDEFMGHFNGTMECDSDGTYCYKKINEEPSSMMPLFSGYQNFSDQRVSMRHNMASDIGHSHETYRGSNVTDSQLTLKKVFDTVYHKELVLVYFNFQSLFAPEIYDDRRSFSKRSNIENYGIFEIGSLSSVSMRQAVGDLPLQRISTRCFTNYLASTVRIKDRTFLAENDIYELNQFMKELRVLTDRDTGGIEYSFVFHGMDCTNHEEIFDERMGKYLSECLGQAKWVIITNTNPPALIDYRALYERWSQDE